MTVASGASWRSRTNRPVASVMPISFRPSRMSSVPHESPPPGSQVTVTVALSMVRRSRSPSQTTTVSGTGWSGTLGGDGSGRAQPTTRMSAGTVKNHRPTMSRPFYKRGGPFLGATQTGSPALRLLMRALRLCVVRSPPDASARQPLLDRPPLVGPRERLADARLERLEVERLREVVPRVERDERLVDGRGRPVGRDDQHGGVEPLLAPGLQDREPRAVGEVNVEESEIEVGTLRGLGGGRGLGHRVTEELQGLADHLARAVIVLDDEDSCRTCQGKRLASSDQAKHGPGRDVSRRRSVDAEERPGHGFDRDAEDAVLDLDLVTLDEEVLCLGSGQLELDRLRALAGVEDADDLATAVARLGLAEEGEGLAVGEERLHRAAPQRGLVGPRRGETLHVVADGQVLLRFVPGEATTTLRVLAARDADLVAVVDDGRPEVGELERLAETHAPRVAARDREDALGVVAPEEVELDPQGGLGVGRALLAEEILELPGIDVALGHELEGRRAERVIHDRVEAVALEILPRVGPDLAADVGVLLRRLDAAAELGPEVRVDRLDLVRHVETPARAAVLDPLLGDVHEVPDHVGVLRVELRQRSEAPPALVIG